MIWECPKCGKFYDGMKLLNKNRNVIGFITENNNEIGLYCFTTSLYNKPIELLLFEYGICAFYCTRCECVADKRINDVKEVIKRIKLSFRNRQLISALI